MWLALKLGLSRTPHAGFPPYPHLQVPTYLPQSSLLHPYIPASWSSTRYVICLSCVTESSFCLGNRKEEKKKVRKKGILAFVISSVTERWRRSHLCRHGRRPMRRQQRVRGRRNLLVLQMCQFQWSSRGWRLRWAPSHHGAGRFSAGVSGKICSCLLQSYLSPIFPHKLSYNSFTNFTNAIHKLSRSWIFNHSMLSKFCTNLDKCHPTSCLGDSFSNLTIDQFFPQIFTNLYKWHTQLVSELWG